MSLSKSSTDPNAEWYILLRGQRIGPCSLGALCTLLETHPEGWSALVWRAGMLDWRQAQRVAALVPGAQGVGIEPAQAAPDAPSAESVEVEHVALRLPQQDAPPPAPPVGSETAPARSPARGEVTADLPTPKTAQRSTWAPYVLAALGFFGTFAALFVFWTLHSAYAPKSVATPAPAVARPVVVQAKPAPRTQARPQPRPVAPPPTAAAPVQPEVPVLHPPSNPPAVALHAAPPATRTPQKQAKYREQQAAATVASLRIRAPWAPVRVGADAQAQVLCSLPRGTVLAVFAELPGTKARWFAVRCDAQMMGWVHENFVALAAR